MGVGDAEAHLAVDLVAAVLGQRLDLGHLAGEGALGERGDLEGDRSADEDGAHLLLGHEDVGGHHRRLLDSADRVALVEVPADPLLDVRGGQDAVHRAEERAAAEPAAQDGDLGDQALRFEPLGGDLLAARIDLAPAGDGGRERAGARLYLALRARELLGAALRPDAALGPDGGLTGGGCRGDRRRRRAPGGAAADQLRAGVFGSLAELLEALLQVAPRRCFLSRPDRRGRRRPVQRLCGQGPLRHEQARPVPVPRRQLPVGPALADPLVEGGERGRIIVSQGARQVGAPAGRDPRLRRDGGAGFL